jgi:WD40 repeat protein
MNDSLPVSVQLWLEEVCGRFEDAWRAAGADGAPPRIEGYLAGAAGSERQALLWELLLLDLHYRRRRGESPGADDYAAGCPDDAEAIRAGLAEVLTDRPHGEQPATDPGRTTTETAPTGAENPDYPTVPGYAIRDKLGQGGMGEVFRGHNLHLGRDVALKVLLPEYRHEPHPVQRFLAEARVHGRLQHPGIAPLHELGELPDGTPYFAMKLVEGRTLADLLKQRADPSEKQTDFLTTFQQVCQAVAYAHNQGIIHRDLKPDNVMVGRFGEVQVMDWGLAKALERGRGALPAVPDLSSTLDGQAPTEGDAGLVTQPGAVLGTYAYMAPEQARGEVDRLDRRSDVFGLGAILCEILTGQPPYMGTPQERKVQAQLGDVAPSLERLRTCGADEELTELARQCLSAHAEERVADAGAVAEAMARYQAGVQERLKAAELERATAAAKAREEQARATAKAERRARRLALGLVAALVVGIVATVYFLIQARDQAGKAEKLAGDEGEARKDAEYQKQRVDEERRKAEALAGKETEARKDAEYQKQRVDEERRKAEALAGKETEARREAEREKQLANQYRTRAEDFQRKAEWLSYAGQLARAQRAWQAGDIVQAQNQLDACQPDLRGWEHRHVSTLINRTHRVLLKHADAVTGISFSPDGARLAGASADKTVRIWDAATGREEFPLRGHTSWVHSVCFSPDGKRLASASHDRTVRLWDATTGREEQALKLHTDDVRAACFSPDGKRLASASHDGTVRVWDAGTGQQIFTLKGHSEVRSVCFSPDGKRLVSTGGFTVMVWDAATGAQEFTLTRLRSDPPSSVVSFSPDGKRLAAADGTTVRVWDVTDVVWQEILTFDRHVRVVGTVCFSPDGKRLASADEDGIVRVWNPATGQETLAVRAHSVPVNAVCFSPDGKRLASAGQDGRVALWNATLGQEERTLSRNIRPATREGFFLPFAPDSRPEAMDWRPFPLTAVCFSSDATLVACGSYDGERGCGVKVWEAATGREVLTLEGDYSGYDSLCFSPDDKRLAGTTAGGCAHVWDMATRQRQEVLKDKVPLACFRFSADGKHLVGVSHGGGVWDAVTRREILKLQKLDELYKETLSAWVSPDGKHLAASIEGWVRLWDITTGQRTALGFCVSCNACFSPDGKRLAIACRDGTVELWDVTVGQRLLTLRGDADAVHGVSFSPDGKRLASAGQDGTVKLWDVAAGVAVLTLNGHTGPVHSVCFSPDGKRLASVGGNWDGPNQRAELKVWDSE